MKRTTLTADWNKILPVVGLELKRIWLARRFWGALILALGPVVLFAIRLVVRFDEIGAGRGVPPDGLAGVYAFVFRAFILRLVLFFGCVAVFSSLFKSDILERTLHYSLLAPVGRHVLVAGKFCAGFLIAFLLYGSSTFVSFLLFYLPHTRAGHSIFSQGEGWDLAGYLCVVLFGCIGYGAVFLLVGLLFRNPVIPAAFVLGWEAMNFLLPPLLKKASVIYYLESLCPVEVPARAFAILAEPAPLWFSIPGLLVLTLVLLVLTAGLLARMDLDYGSD